MLGAKKLFFRLVFFLDLFEGLKQWKQPMGKTSWSANEKIDRESSCRLIV